MLALIESRRQQDGLVRWLVKDGTDDSTRQRVYCVCDAYADAETIAACLNGSHRDLAAENDRLRAALKGIHDMAEGDLRCGGIVGGSVWQIEADARAALGEERS